VVCFVATFITDIVYWRTAAMLWADFSSWLVVVGVMFSVLTAIAGLIDLLRDRAIREYRAAWIHGLGNTAVLVLAFFNALIPTRDAYTSVVPAGLILSGLVVLLLIMTGWHGSALVYRHDVGVHMKEPT
jgi:uncharacterized membrane protein